MPAPIVPHSDPLRNLLTNLVPFLPGTHQSCVLTIPVLNHSLPTTSYSLLPIIVLPTIVLPAVLYCTSYPGPLDHRTVHTSPPLPSIVLSPSPSNLVLLIPYFFFLSMQVDSQTKVPRIIIPHLVPTNILLGSPSLSLLPPLDLGNSSTSFYTLLHPLMTAISTTRPLDPVTNSQSPS